MAPGAGAREKKRKTHIFYFPVVLGVPLADALVHDVRVARKEALVVESRQLLVDPAEKQ